MDDGKIRYTWVKDGPKFTLRVMGTQVAMSQWDNGIGTPVGNGMISWTGWYPDRSAASDRLDQLEAMGAIEVEKHDR